MSASRDALLAVLESGAAAVRMYRPGGLGDCFLLAFPPADAPRFMLVDCGVFFATSGGADRMRAIVADVAEVTGGRLDLLVASHEHWDHLSGFQFAEEQFLGFEVEEVWVAWTEDNTHPLARALRDKRHRLAAALQAAVTEMDRQDDPGARRVADVLGFDLGLDAGGGDRGLGLLGVGGTAGQMDFVCSAFGTPRYLTPGGRAIEWAGSGVRFYVLGPPEDRELITRSDPSANDSEVYERAAALDEASAFALAALDAAGNHGMDDGELRMMDHSRPFDGRYRLSDEEAEAMEFFRQRYGFGDERREGHGPPWRRIGADWLNAAGQLALQLNDDTNNTSLALAVELTASGRVLLFPADAQVGNWLSWQQHVWTVDDGDRDGDDCGGEREVRVDELLARTVLYKVGHHGSHNATLREHGLEKMTHPELVAMIPVDEEQAQEKGWAMPFAPLETRLRERTGGRVLRADRGLPRRPENVPEADWRLFEERTAVDELWVQLAVPL